MNTQKIRLLADLHLHSCLSPCADNAMTPANIVNMAVLAGLDAVALTDHNTCGNIRPFLHFAEKAGLLALPGMELTTREEVHVIFLFPGADEAEDFSRYVSSRLPDICNREDIFGEQILTDYNDEPSGFERRYLLSAADIGIYSAAALAKSYGGVAFPAHIDRSGFSLLSNLGIWDGDMGFNAAERTRRADLSALPDVPYLINSDAHSLGDIPDAEFSLDAAEKTPRGLIGAILGLEGVDTR
jgi:hypothetical protein